MTQLNQLAPQPLWQFFSQICSIPHPSKHEQALSDWIMQWAKSEGLSVQQDTIGNLIIKKPASAGMEHKKGVILQAHIDMVPQKNSDTEHDFAKDPIQAYVDGDWVTAKDTTLGSDNGIGMASCLAVLASKDIAHGPIEVLLTIDEEAGMTGAFGLEPGYFDGEILINTDSEEEGEVYMGCAGGVNVNVHFPIQTQPLAVAQSGYQISVSGLKGGHSGCDIHLGRGNANKIIARCLYELSQQAEFDLTLSQLQGGSLRNAIPREASAQFIISDTKQQALQQFFTQLTNQIKATLAHTEPNLTLSLTPVQVSHVIAKKEQHQLIAALQGCVNGVLRMSDEFAGVVETSSNLGVVKTTALGIDIQCLVRSMDDSSRHDVQNMLASVFKLAGAEVAFDGAYPGWAPKVDSDMRDLVREVYQTEFGSTPKIMMIHAGLECGLFKAVYPDWDMVSIGPTIKFPHSPDEKVHIGSVAKYWQLLVKVLEAIPAK
ncbi:aminoacyl-histidine dipeptidase [Motilimonas cestriensis]|uniref:aminoacyl-histidine dipeptidase n=1 Tax=Motilimonas cestriensis TaxID=2742685 RepID=UPI003DA4ED95